MPGGATHGCCPAPQLAAAALAPLQPAGTAGRMTTSGELQRKKAQRVGAINPPHGNMRGERDGHISDDAG